MIQSRKFSAVLGESLIAQGLVGIEGVALSVAMGRMLSSRGFGEFSVATSVVLLAFNIGNVGLVASTTFFAASSPDEPHLGGKTLGLAVVAGGVSTLISIPVVLTLAPSSSVALPILLVGLVGLLPLMVLNVMQALVLGRHRTRAYNLLSVLEGGAKLVACSLAAATTGETLPTIAAWSAATVLIAVVTTVVARERDEGAIVAFQWSYWRSAAAYGAAQHVSFVATVLNYRLDVLFVASMKGARAAGLYAAATTVGEVLWFSSMVASTVLFPKLASMGPGKARRMLTESVARFVLWTTVPLAGCVVAGSQLVLGAMYGEEYRSAASALRLIVIGTVALSVSRVLGNHIAAVYHPRRNILGSVLGVILNVALNLWAIPRYGIAGAAAATAVSYCAVLISRLVAFARLEGRRLLDLSYLVPQRGDARVAVAALRRAARPGRTT